MIGAETGVVLYDLTPMINEEYVFMSPPEAQVLGRINGDIVSGDYKIELPVTPQAAPLLRRRSGVAACVQVFMTATFIDFWDEYVNRARPRWICRCGSSRSPITSSAARGRLVAAEGERSPAAWADGAAFSADDPLMALPPGGA